MALPKLEINYRCVMSLREALKGGEHNITIVPGAFLHACGKENEDDSPWLNFRTANGNMKHYSSAQFGEFVKKELGVEPGWVNECLSQAHKKAKGKAAEQAGEALSRYATLTGGTPGGNGSNQYATHNNIMSSKTIQGTSATYALRKLRSDAPEIHAEVLSGTLSPHAGMIKAGFRKKTATVSVDPKSFATAILKRFTAEEIREIIESLEVGAL